MNALGATYPGSRSLADPAGSRSTGYETPEPGADAFGTVLGALHGARTPGDTVPPKAERGKRGEDAAGIDDKTASRDGETASREDKTAEAEGHPASADAQAPSPGEGSGPMALLALLMPSGGTPAPRPHDLPQETLETLVARALPGQGVASAAVQVDGVALAAGSEASLAPLAPGMEAASGTAEARTRVTVLQRETHFAPVRPNLLPGTSPSGAETGSQAIIAGTPAFGPPDAASLAHEAAGLLDAAAMPASPSVSPPGGAPVAAAAHSGSASPVQDPDRAMAAALADPARLAAARAQSAGANGSPLPGAPSGPPAGLGAASPDAEARADARSGLGETRGAGAAARTPDLGVASALRGPLPSSGGSVQSAGLARTMADAGWRIAPAVASGAGEAAIPSAPNPAPSLPGIADPGLVTGALPGPAAAPAQQVAAAVVAALPPGPPVLPGAAQGEGPLRLLTLQLHPADLGTVLVRMRLRDGQLALSLQAGREDTARLLREGGAVLNDLLRQAGYRSEAVTVTILPGSPQGDGSANPGSQQGQGAQGFPAQGESGANHGRATPDQSGRRAPDESGAASHDSRERMHESVSSSPDRSGVYL